MVENDKSKRRLINFRWIFFPFLAFLFGIIVSRRLYSGDIEIIVITSIAFLLISAIFIFVKHWKPLVVLLCLFFIGNGYFYVGMTTFNNVKVYNDKVSVIARVTDDIREVSYGNYIIVDNVYINGEKGRNIELYVQNCYDNIKPGMILSFDGELELVKPFTLKSFNSRSYRSGARYTCKVSYNKITTYDGKVKFDEKVRLAVRELLDKHMSEKNAAVAYGVLFGDKNDIDPSIISTYKNVGIIHLLTVSGLHVSFLVTVFYSLLKLCKVNRYVRLVITTLFIAFYAYLCGFTPAVMRAGLMAIVYMASKTFNGGYDSLNSLGLSGFIILLIRPLNALDIGYLMSCFTVYSIILLCPVLTKIFSKAIPHKIAELMALSISAQIGLLPFLAYFGSQVHLLSFMINMIVVPIFSVLYPFLFVVSLLGTFIPFLGYLLVVANFAFDAIYAIARFFEWSGLIIPISADYFGVVVLLFVGIFMVSGYVMTEGFKRFAIFSACSLLLAFAIGIYQIPIKFKRSITVLSSGSSQCLVLDNAKGERMVVGYDYNLLRYHRAYNVGSLECFISTDGRMSGDYIDNMNKLGFSKYISYNAMVEDEKLEIINVNQEVAIGDYRFRYVEYDDSVIGLFIKMDNIRIFVANGNNLSYNIIESEIFPNLEPNIVFVGEKSVVRESDDYILVSTDRQEGANYSNKENGNFRLSYSASGFKARGID